MQPILTPTLPYTSPQASAISKSVTSEAAKLWAEGGPARFYRGFLVKCGFVAINGAIFNTVYVACRTALRMHDEPEAEA